MKRPKSLGEPIASRELVREGSDQPIHVFIWKPFKEDDEVWACPYQVKGFGDEAVHYAYGSDAMQALQLSNDGLRVLLNPKSNKIYWVGPEVADAGFPRTITYAFGADVYGYLCHLLDQELIPFPDDQRRSKRVRTERVEKWKRQSVRSASTKTRKPKPKRRTRQ